MYANIDEKLCGFFTGEDIDFVSLNQTIELSELTLCAPVNITIVNDAVYESNETFTIVASYGMVSENSVSERITILDDESKLKPTI